MESEAEDVVAAQNTVEHVRMDEKSPLSYTY